VSPELGFSGTPWCQKKAPNASAEAIIQQAIDQPYAKRTRPSLRPQIRRNVALMIRDRSHDPAYLIHSGRTHGLQVNI
jgi:hypothetical protein